MSPPTPLPITNSDASTPTRNPFLRGGSRPYSRSELESLIPATSPTSYRRRQRSAHSERATSGTSYLFPDPTSRQPVLSTPPCSGSIYDHALDVLPVLKYGRGICSVNLHPSTERDVAINSFLWKCAQSGEYDSTEGNQLLDVNVLVLSMSTELLKLLRRLTPEEFQGCILDFLSLIDEDDDDHDNEYDNGQNFGAYQHANNNNNNANINIDDDDELDPSTWIQLRNRIANSGRPQSRCENVETLARLCLLTPWKIPVYVTYVTAFDMHNTISISITTSSSKTARTRTRAPSIAVVHWKLFIDWQRYRRLWVVRISLPPIQASSTMMNAILSEQQHAAWAATETVLAASKASNGNNNLLAQLPHDVLWNNLVPRVLYTQCQIEADT